MKWIESKASMPMEDRRLLEADMAPDPMDQFERWFAEARATALAMPEAMTLATASARGVPSARVLLLKAFDREGLVFFTNYGSAKSRDLAENPRAEALFYWEPLHRQVRFSGTVERLDREQSAAYFRTRPRPSQIAAWASRQSAPVASAADLDRAYQEMHDRFAGREVPLPEFWGGYRLRHREVEFWSGRPFRLHDRLRYHRDGSAWRLERLYP